MLTILPYVLLALSALSAKAAPALHDPNTGRAIASPRFVVYGDRQGIPKASDLAVSATRSFAAKLLI